MDDFPFWVEIRSKVAEVLLSFAVFELFFGPFIYSSIFFSEVILFVKVIGDSGERRLKKRVRELILSSANGNCLIDA